jgi:hypothetical protein
MRDLLQETVGLVVAKNQSRHAPYGRPVRIIMGIMIARVFKTSAGIAKLFST